MSAKELRMTGAGEAGRKATLQEGLRRASLWAGCSQLLALVQASQRPVRRHQNFPVKREWLTLELMALRDRE